ncbi:alpha-N-acetylglucosaminidase [Niastella yeongjuensis]|uniref:Alpha-N-acetylglucosaminidase n=1 Tax=Niastella yeongjuensis TaxID=354355 RepID=A0A1V9E9A8_9BACT|nr:alpha-N-acetylglucosaminidase [Niastella yeongjuensis]OQP42718.1 alpha-N-acetylglucosaminidase [Niastella yeongjuensis]SEO51123.1 alpha-N-acetylglucosaminidase [Niastella yeongjuensis]
MQLKCIVLTIAFVASFTAHAADAMTGKDTVARAAYSLIRRILPERLHNSFEVKIIQSANGRDVFELYSGHKKIVLAGSNGVGVASALNYYLKNYAHCDISWNGTNLAIPDPLPSVAVKVRRTTPYSYRYYLNYCTFNYTMSWWNWDRWEKEIDWMALNGINMPLALTGQNIVWYRVYKQLGFTDNELDNFFSGPAYFNWFWMGNLDGWGGPLPMSWMQQHEALQKKILERQRSLGMTPVLPAFTGHVPPAFKKKFPNALLKQTNWSGFPAVSILDPEDSLFIEIGKLFIREQTEVYGTDHLYSSDTFNENKPPTNDSTYLCRISHQVYQAMAAGDPEAKWIMQGWLFHFQSNFWKPAQIKALLNAVPDDKMIILDLWSENNPVWNKTEAYYGKPWIWCMLHNFGGNISMYGRMDEVAGKPASLLGQPQTGKLSGIGLTPEAIEQNPVMYALMLENTWRNKPIDVTAWLKAYVLRRYGAYNTDAEKAWMILKNTVYNAGVSNGGPESIITGRPTFAAKTVCTNPVKGYRPGDILPAWDLMVQASDKLKTSEGFRYDLVDLTRQVLANYADTLQRDFSKKYQEKDKAQFTVLFNQFLGVINDLDTLLATQKDFLLGRWLNDAVRWGAAGQEKKLYEKNARDLITLWGDQDSRLHDYACKQWSGMLKGFYLPRWQQFFTSAIEALESNCPFDQKAFEAKMKAWEWQWVNKQDTYSEVPVGDPIAVAKRLHGKYLACMNKYR